MSLKFREEPFEDTEKQFADMRQLIIESYSTYKWPRNWLIGRMEDWKFGGNSIRLKENPDFFRDNARLWRDEGGRMAGISVSEYGKNSIHMQVHPECQGIERVMISWIIDVWAKNKAQLEMYVFTSDQPRKEILAEFGFEDDSEAGWMREYDLGKALDDVPLAPGFRIERLSENGNYESLLNAVNAAFNRPRKLTMQWLETKLFMAPSLSEEWQFSAVAPDGEHASFCFAWIDRENRIAEIDPIGTDPKYQKKGLAKAVVVECLRRLRDEGIRLAYIASGPEHLPSNKLYESLSPVRKWNERKWVKTVQI
jgi:GNAT superfamily N-acetyltransferase